MILRAQARGLRPRVIPYLQASVYPFVNVELMMSQASYPRLGHLTPARWRSTGGEWPLVASHGAGPAGPAAEAWEGVGAEPQAAAWGRGFPGASTRVGAPASAPSYFWMIPPSSAGDTESWRGMRGERFRGFTHMGTWSPIPTQVQPHPHPHPSAVSQRPAAPPRPTSSSPSWGGRGAVRGMGPSPPIPLLSWGEGVHPLVTLHKLAEKRDVVGLKVAFKGENLGESMLNQKILFAPPQLSRM